MNKKIIIGVIVALIVGLVVGYLVHTSPAQPPVVKGITSTSNIQALTSKIGTGCDNGFTTCTGVVTNGGILSTSTPNSMTLAPSDMLYGFISMTLSGAGGVSITFPATTTTGMSTFLPNVGDNTSFIVYNATSTSNRLITFVAGTGVLLETASSSATAFTGVNPVIPNQREAQFFCSRVPTTDIVCLMDNYI